MGSAVTTKRFGAALAAIGALALTGCGGSGTSDTSPHAQAAVAAAERAGAISTGSHTQSPLHGTGGSEVNDDNPGSADEGDQSSKTGPQLPCSLVSKARVEALVGKPVGAPQEAPLGPTCIFSSTGSGGEVTVSVQPTKLSVAASTIGHRKALMVAGRPGYCGGSGRQTTLVGLSRGRVLTIVAPCAVGRGIAVTALSRLGA
jgi:hypothetical protein